MQWSDPPTTVVWTFTEMPDDATFLEVRNFGFAGTHRSKVGHVAFLFFLGALVLEKKFAAAGDARLQQDQGAVGVDGESLGFFLDGSALGIVAANAHRDLHQDALAASPR